MAQKTRAAAKVREARPSKRKPARKAAPKPASSARPKPAGRPATVEAYLASLPPDRRAAVSAVREAIRRALPAGYEEGMAYGMIGWHVPHRIFPEGYHCDPRQPLPFAGLASQKGHMSLHLMAVYMDAAQRAWFEDAWRASGKKLDMGAACVRFKSVDDLALDAITGVIARIPVASYVAVYEGLRDRRPGRKR